MVCHNAGARSHWIIVRQSHMVRSPIHLQKSAYVAGQWLLQWQKWLAVKPTSQPTILHLYLHQLPFHTAHLHLIVSCPLSADHQQHLRLHSIPFIRLFLLSIHPLPTCRPFMVSCHFLFGQQILHCLSFHLYLRCIGRHKSPVIQLCPLTVHQHWQHHLEVKWCGWYMLYSLIAVYVTALTSLCIPYRTSWH